MQPARRTRQPQRVARENNVLSPWRARVTAVLLHAATRLSDPWIVLGYGLGVTELADDDDAMKFFESLADKQESTRTPD